MVRQLGHSSIKEVIWGKLGKFEYSRCMLHSIVSVLSSLGEIMEYLAMQENIPCSCWHVLKDLQVKFASSSTYFQMVQTINK